MVDIIYSKNGIPSGLAAQNDEVEDIAGYITSHLVDDGVKLEDAERLAKDVITWCQTAIDRDEYTALSQYGFEIYAYDESRSAEKAQFLSEQTEYSESEIGDDHKSKVKILAASMSNYKGKVALLDEYNFVWLGDSPNYHSKDGDAYYDNSNDSLVFISYNEKMFSFLHGSGWTLSQRKMLTMGLFTMEDYQEYSNLQHTVLKSFECVQRITFGKKNEPFKTPLQLSQKLNSSVRTKLQNAAKRHKNTSLEEPITVKQEVTK